MLGQGKKRKTLVQDENRAPAGTGLRYQHPNIMRSRSTNLLSPLKSLKLSPIPRMDESMAYRTRTDICHLCGSLEPDTCSCSSYGSLQDAVPAYLEISQRGESVMTGGDAKMFHPYKGQLKVSVYVNYGLLTVHIVQGRHLVCQSKENCDTYVKLELVPDPSRRTRCRTEVIHDTNHPVFDEKFSFELMEEDMKRRLLLSVWHKPKKGSSEFLGCMSFGVQHIGSQKRTINGWYYLLTEEVGRKKHLQVNNNQKKPLAESNVNIPSVNQDVLWMEPHVIVVRRASGGYGFSLTGCSPVKVCRVDPGSTADKSGLQTEDCIVRINGLNVSRSTAESIARIIRHCSKKIVLEIQRPRLLEPPKGHQGPMSSTVCQPPQQQPPAATMTTKQLPGYSGNPTNNGKVYNVNGNTHVNPPHYAMSTGNMQAHIYTNHVHQHSNPQSNQHVYGSYGNQPPPSNQGYKYLSKHVNLEAEIVDASYYSYGDDVPPPQMNGHHSDSELEVDNKSKKSMPICGTLPRKKTTVKETLL